MGSSQRRPVGEITRGTTHPNRLRRVDRWIMHQVCPILRQAQDPLIVDLGYGSNPVTTQEMYLRLQQHVRPDIEVFGIEIHPDRVAQAQTLAGQQLHFSLGGFEVPVPHNRKPVLIRAFNVLRQYDEAEVRGAWRTMTARLAPSGYLVEGTCDEIGRLSTWVALRSGQESPETFTISLQVNSITRPSEIAPRLPKALIHRNVPGEPIHEFLQQLDQTWLAQSHAIAFGARQRWIATIESLVEQGFPIQDSKTRWRLGEVTVPWSLVAPKY